MVAIRQRNPTERTSPKDRLGLNATQYYEEILHKYLLPMISEGIEVIADGTPCHTSKKICQYKLNNNIHTILWPPSSPDLNLIENVWALLKNKLCKQWRNPDKRPHNRQELIVAA